MMDHTTWRTNIDAWIENLLNIANDKEQPVAARVQALVCLASLGHDRYKVSHCMKLIEDITRFEQGYEVSWHTGKVFKR